MKEAFVILNRGAEGKELRLSDPSTSGRERGFGLNVRLCQRAEGFHVRLPAEARSKYPLRLTFKHP